MKFALNQPFETDQPEVDVDPGLPPGTYRFQLVVVNQAGRRSAPATVTITVRPRTITPPVVVDPRLGAVVTPVGGAVTRPVTPPTPIPGPAVIRRPTNPPTP